MARLSALPAFVRRFRHIASVATCAAAGFLPSAGIAGSLTVESRTIPGLTAKTPIVSHHLRLTGIIDAPDADRLRAELVKLQARGGNEEGPLAVLELSSKGGSLLEGIKIGYLLREFRVATVVRREDACLSACALAFLGGTGRRQGPTSEPSRALEIGGQVGFHNFSVNVAWVMNETRSDPARGIARGFDLARTGAAQMMRYVTDMGVSPGFVARLISLPPEQWQYVETAGDFLGLGIEAKGSLPKSNRPEVQAANVCGHAMGQALTADPSRARRLSGKQAQRQLLEHVRNTVAGTSLKGPLAKQLSAVLDTSDLRLIEGVYGDLRAAGLPLPVPGNTHVELVVDGGDSLRCHVAMSATDPEAFDVVILSERGLTRVDRLPAGTRARMMRYAADEVVNPQGSRGQGLASRTDAAGNLINAK